MARRTSRRGPRVVWLPALEAAEPTIENLGLRSFTVGVTALVPFANVSIPLTIDEPEEQSLSSLADINSSGYRLRRIVGKIFAFGDRFDTESGIEGVAVTAGFIVRRVDAAGQPLATTFSEASPQAITNWQDPWIWRRTWMLWNPELASPFPERLPLNNTDYGSAVDGAHVDQKTARIVGPEERLFLDIGVVALFRGGVAELSNDTLFVIDVRILGSMRTSSGNRNNSSR